MSSRTWMICLSIGIILWFLIWLIVSLAVAS